VFQRCDIRISDGIPDILTWISRCFLQPLNANVTVVPSLDRDDFLPNFSQFIICLSSYQSKLYGLAANNPVRAVGIATGFGLDGRGLIPQCPEGLWDPLSLVSNGTQVAGNLSPALKWPIREAYYSLPSCAKVNNGGAIPSLTHTISWHGASLIKHSENFSFCCQSCIITHTTK
jgi:hypothetical protein